MPSDARIWLGSASRLSCKCRTQDAGRRLIRWEKFSDVRCRRAGGRALGSGYCPFEGGHDDDVVRWERSPGGSERCTANCLSIRMVPPLGAGGGWERLFLSLAPVCQLGEIEQR